MLRVFSFSLKRRRLIPFPLLRRTFSSSPPPPTAKPPINPVETLNKPNNSSQNAPTIHHNHTITPLSSLSSSRTTLLALSATLISTFYLLSLTRPDPPDSQPDHNNNPLTHDFQHAINRIINKMKQTGVAATVLWKSLTSVLCSANYEVRSGFESKVAALLADIAAANESRRVAIVGAGGGAVVDWLIQMVARTGDSCGTQAESARALAYLIADPNVCEAVFERPHVVPNLLRFIFSTQPSKKQKRRSSFDSSDSLKGKSMLVAAIMDIVIANCESADKVVFKPSLPGNAEMRDIAAAIEVIEEGGLHLDEAPGSDEDGDSEIKGIGIKVLGGTSVLGLARNDSLSQASLSSAAIPGLWDDLHSQHIAVPFAAWALANWAMASEANRSHIQELDCDGNAVMTALIAPERSVKWHGSLVARLLLEDQNLPLNESVPDWCFSLLSTVSQASKAVDIPLTQMALSAFLISIKRSPEAQKVVMEKGLHQMRETVKRTTKHKPTQEALAKVLELLSTGDMHMSLEESQKWSAILFPWVFDETSTVAMRSSAINILSCILEDHGPFSVPISQGWLAILLTDILGSQKTKSKGSKQPKSGQVKTQIYQSNIVAATQIANQLTDAVVNLAGNQLGTATESDDSFPLADLLSLEPFVGPFKSLNKDNLSKTNAADSAIATLKGIKALTDICSEDPLCQNKMVDFGVLCLLRRFLLQDDYEKLAANETYDASRAMEAQERIPNVSGEHTNANSTGSTSVRVPPTAHIRRHSARLLNILSVLPNVQKVILEDKTWREWLENCANGKVTGSNDLKTQSYARAILLNVLCNDPNVRDPVNGDITDKKNTCSQFTDMIYLINPEKPHWKCPEQIYESPTKKQDSRTAGDGDYVDSGDKPLARVANDSNLSTADGESCKISDNPNLDVVFVHGLRGGPFKTWRLSEDKSSTKSGLVEKIDEEAGKQGTFWPGEWLSSDFPYARMFTLRYKTNLTQWSGASLPLQEVSAMLLEKLIAAGIGNRPVVFVTHSMGGLVVKQMLDQAKAKHDNLVKNTVGIVFYSCPHFGSKVADMPWRMGYVLRPAPTIGELRSGSPRLIELNNFIRQLHKKGALDVLSFCETKVTPIVEGYGGWALRMEIVPIESAYPGFGKRVVLESTDHVNSCKPLSRIDPSYKETLDFLYTLKKHKS
ncbi:Armadillo-like helical [Heracleum sosnowskyi]|uniref:Armadillo-like helical n=1 Tax=Heracleum sosnowskyi TaxID=360622 RepID=A0AAD8INW8_9APIA|nr:Armadillo-like helical [Heracleum sosnowskyi]